jgi:hypothetical protein
MDSRLEKLKQELSTAVEGMSSEQMRWHPDGKWCAGEVLEHLYLTYTGTIKGFEKVMAGGKPLVTRPSLTHRLRGAVVFGFSRLPSGREAPPNTRPKGLATETIRNEIGEKIVAMDTIMTQCEARFGHDTKLLDHPVLGPLTASQWRKFHLVHGRHHRKQLLRLREGIK